MPDVALNDIDNTDYALALPADAVSDNCALVQGGFGQGPFGERDWRFHAIWNVLTTEAMRDRDPVDDCVFRRWRYGASKVLNRLRRNARDFSFLTNGFKIPSRFDGFAVVVTEVTQDGDTLTMAFDAALQDAGVDLSIVDTDWSFVSSVGRRYTITAVRKDFQRDYLRSSGTTFAWLVELDVTSDSTDSVALTGGRLEPTHMLRHLADHYGVDLVDGLLEPFQRSMVARAERVFRDKGSRSAMVAYARQRGFALTPAPAFYVSTFLGAEFDTFIGEFKWTGFCLGLGNGVANAVDSDASNATFYGVTDAGHSYMSTHRALGEGIVGDGVGAPANDGDTGEVEVRYEVVGADGSTKVFKAHDVRTSATTADIVADSQEFNDAFGTPAIGRLAYDTGKIVVFGVDQSVLTVVTTRPFKLSSRVTVTFPHRRYYSPHSPRIARFDDITADAIPVDTWLIEGYNDASFEFAVTPGAITLASSPYSTSSLHTIRVTYGAGASPIPSPSSPTYPTGLWKLTSPTETWWIERVTYVSAGVDDLVVAGTIPPTSAITKVVHVPQDGSFPDYCAGASMDIGAAIIGSAATYYASPDGGEEARMLNGLKESMLPLHVTVVRET